MFNVKSIIDDLCFDNAEFECCLKNFDVTNPYKVELLIQDQDVINTGVDLTALKTALEEHATLTMTVSKDDLKVVYLKLKDRMKNPRGAFDKQGRFYLTDYELVDVREPSFKYPYSQMNAGRTAKFVKDLAEKYKCQTIEELERVAYS